MMISSFFPNYQKSDCNGIEVWWSWSSEGKVSDFHGIAVGKNQAKQIREQILEDGTRPNTTDSQKIMDCLQHEAEKGDMGYKALFHEVTETTLFAVKVANEKKRREKEHRRLMERKTALNKEEEGNFSNEEENEKEASSESVNVHSNIQDYNKAGSFWNTDGKK